MTVRPINLLVCSFMGLALVVTVSCSSNPDTVDRTEFDSSVDIADTASVDFPPEQLPVDPLSEDAGLDSGKAAAIEALVSRSEAQFGMEVGVAYLDLSHPDADGARFEINGYRSQVSASMIKLLILSEFARQVDAGTIGLDDRYVLQRSDIVGGTGSLQSRGAGASITYAELAEKMIAESDNVATNVLIDRLGMDAINGESQRLGLSETRLNRKMMDVAAVSSGVENYMSAVDAMHILKLIYQNDLASPALNKLALDALNGQTDNRGIRDGLPEGMTFAHKTGTLSAVQNDGGIAGGDRPFILVVFCQSKAGSINAQAAFSLMENIANIIGTK